MWEKLKSRKLLVAVGAAIISFAGSMWPEQEELVEKVVMLAITYIAAQGVVDTATEIKGSKNEHT